MPRVYGITIPAGLEIVYNRTLKMYDIQVHCNVGKNRRFMPREQKYRLQEFSKLLQVAYAWSLMTQPQKDAWYIAGDVIGLNGYALYTQDKVYRLMNGIGGDAVPSVLHQYLVGRLNINAPASTARIIEHHVTPISLPADLSISYKSNLTSVGGGASATVTLRTLRMTGGQNIWEDHVINLSLSHVWENLTLNIPTKVGIMTEWEVIIELTDVIGELLFDNVIVQFDAEIKTWDPFCNEVTQYWIPDDVSEDVDFESVYPT